MARACRSARPHSRPNQAGSGSRPAVTPPITRADRYAREPVKPGTWAVEHRTRVRRGRSRAHQMQAVSRTTQPIIRLAAILAKLDKDIPQRRGKRLETLLAYMILLGDWRSGRRSRPGRDTSAEILDVTPDTVRRLWRRLERLEVIERTAEGTRLPHAVVRLQDPEEYHVAQRAEWTVRIPADIYAEDVTLDHIERAVAVFADLAERLAELDADLASLQRPLDAMRQAWHRLTATGPEQGSEAYCGPIYGFLFSTVPSRESSSPPSTATGRTTKSAAAPRRQKSATTSQRGRRGRPQRRRMNPDAVALARELRDERRLPQLRDANVAVLAACVHSRALAGWTASDVVKAVEAACQRRAEQWGYYDPPVDPKASVAWLSRLLKEVADVHPVEVPPHRAAAEAAERIRAERAEAARRRAEQQREAGPSRRPRIQVPTRRRSRATARPEDLFADTVAGRGRAERIHRQDQAPAPVTTWRPPEPTAPRCELCGERGHDVAFRIVPSRGSVEVCEGCHVWHSRNPILAHLDLG